MKSEYSVYKSSYLPVAWEFKEALKEEIRKSSTGKIFYFDHNDQLEQSEGRILQLAEAKEGGLFIWLDPQKASSATFTRTSIPIRIDRVITFFGKIGPAYDEYDAFANACMDCKGD